MLSLNWLCRYACRPPLASAGHVKSLTTSSALLKHCGKSSSRDRGHSGPCEPKKSKKVKTCDKNRSDFRKSSLADQGDELPDYCSKKMAMECAKRIKELQAHWEAVAAAAQAQEERRPAGGEGRKSGCPVKPPVKEESGGGSNTGVVLGAVAVLAGLLYYLYQQQQLQEGEGEGEKNDKGE